MLIVSPHLIGLLGVGLFWGGQYHVSPISYKRKKKRHGGQKDIIKR